MMRNKKIKILFAAGMLLYFMIILGCEGKIGITAKPPPRMYKITASNQHGVDAVGKTHIWSVGAYGSINHTNDGGKTWKKQVSKTENLLCEVDFIDEKVGWACGIYGIMLHTQDGGQTWTPQKTGTEEHLHDVFFVDRNTGWTVGSYGTILHTSDGGKSWVSQIEEEDFNANGIYFLDTLTGWVVGEFGTIFRTDDGGKTWNRQKPPMLFINEDDEWGDPPLAIFGVKFLNKNRGFVVGMEGLLLRTDDGGVTWEDLRSMTAGVRHPLYTIEIIGNRGWSVGKGGSYLETDDGGKTWKVIDGKIKTRFWLHDIAFGSPEEGWIVGARGAVVQTKDGGKSWTMLSGLTYDVPEFGLVDFE